MAEDVLQLPLQFLKGVGPRKAADLKKAGLNTVEDLLFRFPRRYEDRSRMQTIISLRPGMTAAISGKVLNAGLAQTRRPGFKLFSALVQDDSGQIQAVWPNQAFLKDVIKSQQRIVLFGKVEIWGSRGLQITDPEFEIVKEGDQGSGIGDQADAQLHTGRIVPVYERTGSVTTNMQRRFVWQALEQLPDEGFDPVPDDILARERWPSRKAALWAAHFPPSETNIDALNAFMTPAQRRLVFEDFFVFQTGLALRRHENAQVKKGLVSKVDDRIRQCARAVLPFKLTDGQREALAEIVADMQKAWPMQRLLQGDVGAGKTIVALLAAIVAIENGYQIAFMAPTEILAEQHYRTIVKSLDGKPYRVALLTGRVTAAMRRDLLPSIERGDINLIVGTQALIQEHVKFKALALAVIDEQHRFGVVQRGTLAAKGSNPDVLVMTATPIPRTLALTECGDMEVSVIRGLPPGRQPIKTLIKADSRRDEVYAMMREEITQGRQVYVIYPLVEDSEKIDLKAATAMSEQIAKIFPEFAVALLHGRMKGDDKEAVMHRFNAGQLHILVATTVVEVGVDVPNATLMVIEHAERFGLSQLHQLRGRIGRGRHASTCVLMYQPPWTDDARERLKAMSDTSDGFVIAERDLQLRGPGDFFGTRQSGLPTLRAGDLKRVGDLLERAYEEARARVDAGTLTEAQKEYVRSVWQRQFGMITVG
ncbi:MAG: ATP-dependent DNA helicase RecG [Acidobacteriota bacterium]